MLPGHGVATIGVAGVVRRRSNWNTRYYFLLLRQGRGRGIRKRARSSRSFHGGAVQQFHWLSELAVPRRDRRIDDHAGTGRDHRGVHWVSRRRNAWRRHCGGRRRLCPLPLRDPAGAVFPAVREKFPGPGVRRWGDRSGNRGDSPARRSSWGDARSREHWVPFRCVPPSSPSSRREGASPSRSSLSAPAPWDCSIRVFRREVQRALL